MRTRLLLYAGLLTATAAQAQDFYNTNLSGHQQVPSVATLAEAGVNVGVNRADRVANFGGGTDTLALTSPIDESIGAHIHLGYTGENGPILVALPYENLFDDDDNFVGARLRDTSFFGIRETLYDTLVTALDEGRAYVNVHTANYPGGEVRGQLINFSRTVELYDAMAYGEQQNPAVLTEGMGGVTIEVATDTIYVTGAFELESPAMDVAGSPAHLHLGSFGQNGGVQVVLEPTLSDDRRSGVFERSRNAFARIAGLSDSMFRGRVYVNFHSEAYPAGEIRGQVVRAYSNVYHAHVSEIDPRAEPSATRRVKIMAEKPFGLDQIVVSGAYGGYGFGLTGNATPFVRIRSPFQGAATALSAFGLASRYDADEDVGVITQVTLDADDTQLEGLFLRFFAEAGIANASNVSFYAQDFAHECKRVFYSGMTAAQSVPGNGASSGGEFNTEYYGDRISVNGFVAGLSSAIRTDIDGGFHIHNGLAGSTGPIVAPVGFLGFGAGAVAFLPDRAIVNLTDEQATAMKERRYYYNIHTEDYPMGEVRGQILPRANSLLHSVVSPTQATPGGFVSRAHGGVLVELDENSAKASGSFNALNGFDPSVAGGAHLHAGMPGVAGPIVYPLVTDAGSGASEGEFLPSDNTIVFDDARPAQLDSMLERTLYVNIHSTLASSGEIRGQLAPYMTNHLATALSPAVTLPYTGEATMNQGTGRLVSEVYGSVLYTYGTIAELSSPIDLSIGGGAHLHEGFVAETGDVIFPLDFEGTPGTSGVIPFDSNRFTLDTAQLDRFFDGGYYANFHTQNAPSGAIRGQVLLGPNRYPDAVTAFTFPADGDTVRLATGELDTEAVIDWEDAADPDSNRVAYYWTLFTDTTAAPVVRTEIAAESQVVFTFGTLDTLLSTLGLDSGAQATVFHQAWSTDGAVVTPGDLSAVTLVRRGMLVGIGELPAGAAHLFGSAAADALTLEVTGLDAGELHYDLVSTSGQSLRNVSLDHAGGAQRYRVATDELAAGMYFLRLTDGAGASRAWGFMVR